MDVKKTKRKIPEATKIVEILAKKIQSVQKIKGKIPEAWKKLSR